jgi:hypothetical protein
MEATVTKPITNTTIAASLPQQLAIVPKLLCRVFGQILAKFYRIQPGHAQRPFGQVVQ